MDWKWVIPIAITLGFACVGGVFALVKLVATLVSEATALKVRLDLVIPIAHEMPIVKQSIAVHERRLDDQDDEVDQLRAQHHTLANEITRVSLNGGRR